MKITLNEQDVINHLTDYYQHEFGEKLGAVIRPTIVCRNPIKIAFQIDVIRDDEEIKEERSEDVEL